MVCNCGRSVIMRYELHANFPFRIVFKEFARKMFYFFSLFVDDAAATEKNAHESQNEWEKCCS